MWRSRLTAIGPTWWALIGSAILALIDMHPTLRQFGTEIAGGKYNGHENLWNDYWLRTALFHLHQSPFFSKYIDYPNGVSLRFRTLNPLAAGDRRTIASWIGMALFATLIALGPRLERHPFAPPGFRSPPLSCTNCPS